MYLTINHGWRIFGSRLGWRRPAADKTWLAGFLLTFLSVVVAMVVFRSVNFAAVESILRGMVGLNGIGLPPSMFDRVAAFAARLPGLVYPSQELSATDLVMATAWVLGLLSAVLLLPNTLQVMDRFEPALTASRATLIDIGWLRRTLAWSPSLAWATAMAVLLVAAVLRIGGQSEFLYWQF
jgi:uncharacterized membrane protein